ncbi:MAG: hypothetical protein GWN58_26180 [Anaerolineae bacterium]|nr:hypothetical protein [Anaerolineae bacterium]
MTERDANGRFVKGKSGNPKGRPKKKREERYYEILVSTVTFDDWKAIVKKAASQAMRGDATARKWLADYIVGTPEHNLSLDHVIQVLWGDGEPIGEDA